MIDPGLPADESARLAELRALAILDTPREDAFDNLMQLAASIFGVPIALVALVDEARQWFKAAHGLCVSQTPRDISFCTHVVFSGEALVVEDAACDPRFADNPLVTGAPHVRFYAGEPLRSDQGFVLGTLCLIDTAPRRFEDAELARRAAHPPAPQAPAPGRRGAPQRAHRGTLPGHHRGRGRGHPAHRRARTHHRGEPLRLRTARLRRG